jgi:site-specific DNA recombinase
MTAERTTAALRYKKTHGQVYNHAPYGFNAEGGVLVPDRTEQAVIARMATLRKEGTSYNEIANVLNADKVPTKQGGIWRSQTVKNIILAN